MKNLKHIFILFVMMCMLVAASACTKEHSFGEKWMNDETNHWHSCSDEGCEELSDKAAHTFGEGVVTTPATEEAEGVLTSACTVCGYEKTESIPKLPHTHNLSKVDEKSEDCTNNGTEAYYTCSGCELIFSDAEGKNVIEAPVVIPATGHDWEDATCEAPKTCINCETTEGAKLDHTPDEAIEENRQEATCGSAGSYDSVIKCADCGFEISRETKEIPATGNHVYVTEIERVPAKCEVDGYVVKECNCGATEKTALKAPGYHTYDNDEDMICNVAGCGFDRSCKHTNTEVIPAVDATCTSNGLTEGEKCKDCGHITIPQTETEMADHTPGDPKEENRSEAGCLEDGSYEKVVKCSECGHEISRETVVIKAPGHHTYDDDQDMICNNCPFDRSCKHTNTEVIPAVDATCTSNGLTEGAKCKDCGHITIPQTETEMAEHTKGIPAEESRVEATCGLEGSYTIVVRCSVCTTYVFSTEINPIPATGNHTYSGSNDMSCDNCSFDRSFEKLIYENNGYSLNYQLYMPSDASEGNKYPLILFLHGAGERGNDNLAQMKNAIMSVAGSGEWAKSVIIAPQCPADTQWVGTPWANGNYQNSAVAESQVMNSVIHLVKKYAAESYVDTSRIYVVGLSMGGFGTWDIISRYPELFAAAVPICGGGPTDKIDVLVNIPIYTFHGTADTAVPYAGTKAMYDAIVGAGGNKIIFYTFDGAGHAIWEQSIAFAGDGSENYPSVESWLFAQKKEAGACKHINLEILPEVPGSCTSTGLTAGEKCADCGFVFVAQKETPKAHTYDNSADECCNVCGAYVISVSGGTANVDNAFAGDTVTLVASDFGANRIFSHWILNGEILEGNSFVMPEGKATVSAAFIEKIAIPDNSTNQLVFKPASGEIQIDRMSGNTMFDAGVDYILIHIYDDVNGTNKLGEMILYVTPGADCQGGKVIIGYVSTVDGSVKRDIVTGVKGNYWIVGGNIGKFYEVVKAAVGYKYTAGGSYYLAFQAVAFKTPVVEKGIEITYKDSDVSVIGTTPMVYDSSNPGTVHTIKVDGGLIEGQYTELQVGYGNAVTFTTEAKDGYNFAGWYLTDENGEATGNALSVDLSYTYTVKSDVTLKPVFTQDAVKLAAPDNSDSKLIYKEGTGGAAIALDRKSGNKLFVTGVSKIMFYVYTSADANKEDYIARFYMYGYDGAATTNCITSFATLDGVEYKYIRGGNGGFWITDTGYFFGMLADLIGYDYSDGQNYYFAAQRIAEEGTIYADSDISEIGANGFCRNENASSEKFTVTVENGLIDGELTTVKVGYGVVLNITSNAFEDSEFGYWKYVTYADDGSETLGAIVSDKADFTLTVKSSLTIRAVAMTDVVKTKLEAPDNSNNQMISFNGGTTEYDRQKNADGSRKTAFTDGVAYIRYYIYIDGTDGEKILVSWFDIDKNGYLYSYNGTKSSWGTNGGKCYGGPGNFYGIDGNWHNFIKNSYNQGAAAKGLSNWSNSVNHYFACQAITDNVEFYENSEIGTFGKGWGAI